MMEQTIQTIKTIMSIITEEIKLIHIIMTYRTTMGLDVTEMTMLVRLRMLTAKLIALFLLANMA